MKNFINKSFSLLNAFLNTFMSPKKVFTEELAKQRRLQRYIQMPLEGLEKVVEQLEKQSKDIFSFKDGTGEKLDDAKLILNERKLRMKSAEKEEARKQELRLAKRKQELRLLSINRESTSAL